MVARDFEVPADANTDNIYEVTIIATDVDNNTDSETQTVTVTDAAETATGSLSSICYSNCLSFTICVIVYISSNDSYLINIVSISISWHFKVSSDHRDNTCRPSLSGNTPIGRLIYTLGGADAAGFSIDSSTGIISMVARDFEVPADALDHRDNTC
jgi:hypothetical protein